MMMLDPKKSAAAIVGKRKSAMGDSINDKPIHTELTKPTDGELDPKHMACEDIITALHMKNASRLKEALSNFHDLHSMDRESEKHHSPDDSEESFLA